MHYTAYRGQDRRFCTIFDGLGVDLAASFTNAKDERIFSSSTMRLVLDATRPEAFVEFDGATETTFKLARLGHAFVQTGEERGSRCCG